MGKINQEFDKISQTGVEFISVNTNALTEEGREQVLDKLGGALGDKGRVRLIMHSIALGNLKLIAPRSNGHTGVKDRELLAAKLGVNSTDLQEAVNGLFEAGNESFYTLADSPDIEEELLLEEEDVAQTVYAMGTSLLSWVQDVYNKGLFAADARILAMTSEGNQSAIQAYAAVSAAKAALEAVSRSIAVEFGPHGVRSNVIQAGVTDTPALRLIPGNQHLKAKALMRNPLKRLTRPEDVAGVVALLASDEAAWINGEIIRVDGGEHVAG